MEAEMTLRPMTAAEQPYCYSQPLSILNRVGCIGYLRGDLVLRMAYFCPHGRLIVRT